MMLYSHRALALMLGSLTLWFAVTAMGQERPQADQDEVTATRARVDQMQKLIAEQTREMSQVATIDHHRLAEEVGVAMPPCVVTITSAPEINAPLLKVNPRLGLDLPLKFLTYAEPDGTTPLVAFPSSAYLAARHRVPEQRLLDDYQTAVEKVVEPIPSKRRKPVTSSKVERDYGIVEIESKFDFDSTIVRLKEAVLKQGDTVWFGELDFQAEAATQKIKLPRITLLLFGGPGPGGKAMASFPRLGLDAFCQKLLVYETQDGSVLVLFNDIEAFAKLHYGKSEQAHRLINRRLISTFQGAVQP